MTRRDTSQKRTDGQTDRQMHVQLQAYSTAGGARSASWVRLARPRVRKPSVRGCRLRDGSQAPCCRGWYRSRVMPARDDAVEGVALEGGAGERGAVESGASERGAVERAAGEHDAVERDEGT